MFKDKSKYPTLTRMSYCQCRLKLVFASVFRQFNWKHVALLVDRSELFSLTVGKNLEYGLRQEGLLSFVRELNGNEEEIYENYLRDASMYARGKKSFISYTYKMNANRSLVKSLQWSYCLFAASSCGNSCWPPTAWA